MMYMEWNTLLVSLESPELFAPSLQVLPFTVHPQLSTQDPTVMLACIPALSSN